MKTRSYIIVALLIFTLVMPFAVNAGIAQSIVSIFGFFTGVGGWMFNVAMNIGVIDVRNTIGAAHLGSVIDEMWKIVRDLVNLTLVFGLVYVGLMTIIHGRHGAHLSTVLKNIILCALLVNFSLYFTKVIIDVSNATSVAVYNQMILSAPKMQSGGSGFNYGISGAFMEAMGLSTFFKTTGVDPNAMAKTTDDDGGFMYAVVGVIFMIIAAFVFFAGALLLLIRLASLIMLMIFSPILFAAATFKQTAAWRNWWIQSMTDQAIFPPVLMFMLWISYKVVYAMFQASGSGSNGLLAFVSGPGSFLASASGASTSNNPVLGFLLGAVLMVGSLIAAKKAGAVGGDMALNIAKMGTRAAGSATAGSAAYLARITAGRAANAVANSDALKEREGMGFTRRWANYAARSASGGIASSSFDIRATRAAQGAAKAGGVDIGTAHEGGYTAMKKEKIEAERRYADSLGKVDDNDPMVLARKAAVELAEDQLAGLKAKQKADMDQLQKDRNAAAEGSAERVALDKKMETTAASHRQALHHVEEAVAKAKDAVEREKNRRQIGAATTAKERENLEYQQLDKTIRQLKASIELSAALIADPTLDPNNVMTQQELIDDIKKQQKAIKATEQQQNTLVRTMRGRSTDGRADVVEMTGWSGSKASRGVRTIYAFATGSNPEAEAKEIREKWKEKPAEKKKKGGGGDHGGGGAAPKPATAPAGGGGGGGGHEPAH